MKLREGIQERWRELRAVQLVVEEVAAQFDGEDPALPKERQALDDSRGRVRALYRETQTCLGRFKLSEPEDELLNMVREGVRREGERFE